MVSGKTVVVCKEKHGTRYFVVESDEELFRTSLVILRGRLKGGWYYEPGEPPPKPDFSKEDVEKMPASLRNSALSKLKEHEDSMKYWKDVASCWEAVNQAAAEADGRLAWEVLDGRSDHEYEYVGLEPVSTEYR